MAVISCCLGSADPKRTWSGIGIPPAILAIQEVSTHSTVVLCGRRGCSGSVGCRGSCPLRTGKSMCLLGVSPIALYLAFCLSCSFSAPSSLDLFFRWLFDTHFLDEAEIKFQ